jgi:hypothetical protein
MTEARGEITGKKPAQTAAAKTDPITVTVGGRTRFLVILEGAAVADTAHAHTLRYLLKYLLRSRGLRCIEARQLTRLVEEGAP